MATSNSKQSPQKAPVRANQSAAEGVASLKRIVYLLFVVLLVSSACSNVYLVWNQTKLDGKLGSYDVRLQNVTHMSQFLQRFMAEVRQLGRTNKQVADLLQKHHEELLKWGLTSRAQPSPGS